MTFSYKAIQNRPGLYEFDLPDPPCLPGQFRVVRWGLIRKDPLDEITNIKRILDNQTEESVAALILINMKEDYYPRCLEKEKLRWLGTSKTRIYEDNRVSDDPIDEVNIRITLDRLAENDLITVVVDPATGEVIYFPTRKLIMKMVGNRRNQ